MTLCPNKLCPNISSIICSNISASEDPLLELVPLVCADHGRQQEQAAFHGHRPSPGRAHRDWRLSRGFVAAHRIRAARALRGHPPHRAHCARELQQQGLISRRKNVGSRVEAAGPRRLHAVAGFGGGLGAVRRHSRARGAVGRRGCRPAALAKVLGCPGGTRWLRISSLRMDGDRNSRRSAGPTSTSTPPTRRWARPCGRNRRLISSLIESRYGRRIARSGRRCAPTVPAPLADAFQVRPALRR